MHGRLSAIEHDEGALFAGIPQGFMAVRYHSLVVGALPPEPARHRVDPDGVVMALEHRSRPLYGVQFHPESVATRARAPADRELPRPHARPGARPAARARSRRGPRAGQPARACTTAPGYLV